MLTARHLKNQVSGSFFGGVWLIATPLALLAIYTFVFGSILNVRFSADSGTGNFALYLFAGLVPFLAFRQPAEAGAKSLIGNRQLVQRSGFPPVFYPSVIVFSSVVTELIGLGVLLLALVWEKGALSMWWLLLPLPIFVRVVLTLAVTWLLSVLTPFIRDISKLTNLLFTLLFFGTPILYPRSRVPEEYDVFIQLNPLTHLIDCYRSLLIEGGAPSSGFYWVLGISLLGAFLSYTVFSALVGRAKDLL